jgi:hypothetical protein
VAPVPNGIRGDTKGNLKFKKEEEGVVKRQPEKSPFTYRQRREGSTEDETEVIRT